MCVGEPDAKAVEMTSLDHKTQFADLGHAHMGQIVQHPKGVRSVPQ